MPPSADLINKTILKAYGIFTIKETWFYRDWQIALGDIMIEQVSGSSRRFDIIGFGELSPFGPRKTRVRRYGYRG
jgi:hypothetical protein